MNATPDVLLKIRTPDVPLEIHGRLFRHPVRYTNPVEVFHLVWLHSENFCGVYGDGANSAYEWFVFQNGQLETSDCGYGSTAIALRDVLVKLGDGL